ncbi:hypothetical protein LLG46_08115 [bacterium]|nr:hypothetical protein [bacterium]
MKYWIAIFVLALALAGCGRQNVNLPGWAPKNPSSGFVRAANALKSFPDGSDKAQDARLHQILVPAWEFLGTLGDDQISSLTNNKQLRLPYGSLTKAQQSLISSFFETYRQTMKNVPPSDDWPSDELAEIVKLGAKQDLSNVDIQLDIRANNLVRFACVIQYPNGSESKPLPLIGLGYMR